MKTGIIDVGGGQRGIFACGVFDRLMDEGICFDLGIGVSAGSANISSYIAGQRGRNLQFYLKYIQREEYLSRSNLREKGCMLDVQYIYGALSNSDGENPLDYAAFEKNPMDFLVVATGAKTGLPAYMGKQTMRPDCYNALMASSAIPYICAPQTVDGTVYFDGSISDPIPLDKAFSLGCEKVVLLLNCPVNGWDSSKEDKKLAKHIEAKYPHVAHALCQRTEKYNEGVEYARRAASEGRVLILAPQQLHGVGTLCKDISNLWLLYEDGYQAGAEIRSYLDT